MDFISSFVAYTEGLPTPECFRLWTAISTIACALERRVWTCTAGGILYPNMYVVLVAPPAVGKSVAINRGKDLLVRTEGIKLASDSITDASLIDELNAVPKQIVTPPGASSASTMLDYHALSILAPEIGVLLPEYSNSIIGMLNKLFDCDRDFKQTRRTNKVNITIPNPCLNILAGAQPGWLASTFPEEAWSMGFASRMLMVYACVPVKVPLFTKRHIDKDLESQLLRCLSKIEGLKGEIEWSEDAAACMERWAAQDCRPVPVHSKLQHYNGRRVLNTMKLCMVSCVSRGQKLCIEQEDFERAQEWLLQIEERMPDIFRDMIYRSDNDIIQELHYFAWRKFSTEGHTPVADSLIVSFMQSKVPSEKMFRILEVAERAGVITRGPNNTWIPSQAPDQHLIAG